LRQVDGGKACGKPQRGSQNHPVSANFAKDCSMARSSTSGRPHCKADHQQQVDPGPTAVASASRPAQRAEPGGFQRDVDGNAGQRRFTGVAVSLRA